MMDLFLANMHFFTLLIDGLGVYYRKFLSYNMLNCDFLRIRMTEANLT